MSILSGYDMVIELSREKVEALIATASIGGQSLTPPTELALSAQDVALDLMLMEPPTLAISTGGETNWATITLSFQDSLLTFKGQTLTPAKGTISIAGFFDMTDAVPNPVNLPKPQQIAFFPKKVTHTFDDTDPVYADALAGLSDRAGFETTMDSDLSVGLQELGALPAGPLWAIDPTQNGTIGGQFCALSISPISSESIGLFGIVLEGNLNQGQDSSQATSSLTGGASVAVTISAAAFHDLVWCPTLGGSAAAALAKNPGQLAQWIAQNMPADCGSGGMIPFGSGYLTSIGIEFVDGAINVSGGVYQGDPGPHCFSASGTFATQLTFALSNGALVPQLKPNPPTCELSFDISWYCVLLFVAIGAIAGAIGAVVVGFLCILATAIGSIVLSAIGMGDIDQQNPVQVGLDGITWTATSISPEGLTLLGNLPTPTPVSMTFPHVWFDLTSATLSTTKVGSGTYHFPGSKACPPADFAYEEDRLDTTTTATASEQMIGTPRTYAWTIGDSPAVPLTGSSGTATVNVYASLPTPGGVATQLGMRALTVDYSISDNGTTLTLTDRNHLVYSLLIRVDCTDATQLTESYWQEALIVGDQIAFGDDYTKFMEGCMVATRALIGSMKTLPQGVPRNGDPGQLTDEQLVAVLALATQQGELGDGAALAEVSALRGSQLRSEVFVSIGAASGERAGQVVGE